MTSICFIAECTAIPRIWKTHTAIDGTSFRIGFCSDQCQQRATNSPEYQDRVSISQARRQLYRAGQLLKEVFYIFREKGFNPTYSAAAKNNHLIHIWQIDQHLAKGMKKYNDIRPQAFNNEDHAAFLTHNSCGLPPLYFQPLIRALLAGLANDTNMREHQVDVHPHRARIIQHQYDHRKQRFHAYEVGMEHKFITIMLEDGEEYIVDLAGAQFGQYQAVVPGRAYRKEYVEKVREMEIFGWARVGMEVDRMDVVMHSLCTFGQSELADALVGKVMGDKEKILLNMERLDEFEWNGYVVEYASGLRRYVGDWLEGYGGYDGLETEYVRRLEL